MKNVMAIVVAAVCAGFGVSAALAETVYVGTENAADDAEHGASADKPFASIQYAADYLGEEGGTVYVAKGTYESAVSTDNGWSVYITNAISVVGATGNSEDVILRPLKKNTQYRSKVIYLNHPKARLYHLTVAEGYSKDKNNSSGHNVCIGAKGGTVEECIIRDAGGGHWSSEGLGLYMSTGLVSRCLFKNNSATINQEIRGAALFANDGLVENCLFTGSSCKSAAAVCIKGNARMVNCTIAGNTGTSKAGVWTLAHSSYGHIIPRVVNCAIFNNTVTSDDTGHGHVWYNKDGCFYNCASELASFGAASQKNVLSAKPYFKDTTAADYHISAASDLLDAGCDPTPYLRAGMPLPTVDLDGNPRVVDTIDIGCYENQKNDVECGISVTASSHVLPTSVTLTALPSGTKGAVNFLWSMSNEVTGVIEQIDAGAVETTTWAAANAGTFSAYLTLTDDNGAHSFSLMQCLKLTPRDLYVDLASENPEFPYDAPGKAAKTVHVAVAAACDGATVHVAEGDHTQGTVLNVNDAIAIVGADPEHPERTVLRNTRNASYDDRTGRVIYLNNAGASVCHLTAANGYVDNFAGACICVDANGGTVSNCVIYGGSSQNHSVSGDGVYLSAGLLTHCVISNCAKRSSWNVESHAVAVCASGSSRVSNCLITKNQTARKLSDVENLGGLIASVDGTAVMENCTIVGNVMFKQYGALRVASANAIARNCVIADNYQTNGVDLAGAWVTSSTSVPSSVFVNCAADADTPINDTCRVAPAAKLFKDVAAGDYTPATVSVLCNHGATPLLLPSIDLAGNPRVFGRAIDIGAFECQRRTGIMLIVR